VVGAQYARRVWVKRQDNGRATDAVRMEDEPFDQLCMSSVNPVEIADREGTAAKR
jgi:hypothetical protein